MNEDVAQEVAAARQNMPRFEPASEQGTAATDEAQTAEPQEEESFEFPELEPVDLAEFADDDEDDDPRPVATEDDDEDEDIYEDPEKAELKRRLRAAEKKAEYAEQLRLKEAQTKWRGKMEAKYPLADWDSVSGTSRRAFEKAAALSHNSNLKIVGPILEKAKAAIEAEKAKARGDAKAEVQAAWGRPTTGPAATQVTTADAERELAEARKSGSLTKVIAAMRKVGA